jgi:patatin-related protein
MRELELRLALVFYGGASLAVYMSGVSNEILKLVRASSDFHSSPPVDEAAATRPGLDTEPLYVELLQALGRKVEVRVIVDVISGASAGGINSIFLARALAHDLALDPLREMWLNLADIEELMEPQTLSDRRSKLYLYPLLWMFRRRALAELGGDREARRKVFRFVRSRWFEPPFSGRRMLDWMLDACARQGRSKTSGGSLLPRGQRLDLFVSLTNFFGQRRRLQLHDPPEISERRHGIMLNFTYRRDSNKTVDDDFDDDNIPGLAFGARATSSFPGAFPAFSLADLNMRLAERDEDWPMRERFLRHNFAGQWKSLDQLENVSFMDGGIVDNKPFAAARDAIFRRAAHRQVDRRIVYLDPAPIDEDSFVHAGKRRHPGFFRMILSAIAEIPRNEPIYADLKAIADHNEEVKKRQPVFKAIAVSVNAAVDEMLMPGEYDHIDAAAFAGEIERAHVLTRERSGLGYAAYVQSRIVGLLDRLADVLAGVFARQGNADVDFSEALLGWAETTGLLGGAGGDGMLAAPATEDFLRRFDVDYRIRRLRHVIECLNAIMQDPANKAMEPALRDLKKQCYGLLEDYQARWQPAFHASLPVGTETPPAELIGQIGGRLDLETLDSLQNQYFAESLSFLERSAQRDDLLRSFLGFSFFDALALPIMSAREIYDHKEVRVDRISPADCGDVFSGALAQPLRGRALGNFAAFFSRGARENDYTWGRLHAAKRLLDLLIDAAGPDALPDDFDLDAFRFRLFDAILNTEQQYFIVEKGLPERVRAGVSRNSGKR